MVADAVCVSEKPGSRSVHSWPKYAAAKTAWLVTVVPAVIVTMLAVLAVPAVTP